MSKSTNPEKPISQNQKEALEVFKAHLMDEKNEHREGWLIADQAGVKLLTIRALETRGLLEPAYKGSDWSTLPYKITEKGLLALSDPESVIRLTEDMDKALSQFYAHDEWIYPWAINVHENTLKALLKRDLVESKFLLEGASYPAYKITEKGKDHVIRQATQVPGGK